MKNNLCDYEVKNIFVSKNEEEMKEKINSKIRSLCVMDVEKIYSFDYDTNVVLSGDNSEFEKGEVS